MHGRSKAGERSGHMCGEKGGPLSPSPAFFIPFPPISFFLHPSLYLSFPPSFSSFVSLLSILSLLPFILSMLSHLLLFFFLLSSPLLFSLLPFFFSFLTPSFSYQLHIDMYDNLQLTIMDCHLFFNYKNNKKKPSNKSIT